MKFTLKIIFLLNFYFICVIKYFVKIHLCVILIYIGSSGYITHILTEIIFNKFKCVWIKLYNFRIFIICSVEKSFFKIHSLSTKYIALKYHTQYTQYSYTYKFLRRFANKLKIACTSATAFTFCISIRVIWILYYMIEIWQILNKCSRAVQLLDFRFDS